MVFIRRCSSRLGLILESQESTTARNVYNIDRTAFRVPLSTKVSFITMREIQFVLRIILNTNQREFHLPHLFNYYSSPSHKVIIAVHNIISENITLFSTTLASWSHSIFSAILAPRYRVLRIQNQSCSKPFLDAC